MIQFTDYPSLNKADKAFIVRMVFHDCLETAVENRKRGKGEQSLLQIINNDKQEYLRVENYEACQLYNDLQETFKYDILDFEQNY